MRVFWHVLNAKASALARFISVILVGARAPRATTPGARPVAAACTTSTRGPGVVRAE